MSQRIAERLNLNFPLMLRLISKAKLSHPKITQGEAKVKEVKTSTNFHRLRPTVAQMPQTPLSPNPIAEEVRERIKKTSATSRRERVPLKELENVKLRATLDILNPRPQEGLNKIFSSKFKQPKLRLSLLGKYFLSKILMIGVHKNSFGHRECCQCFSVLIKA
ncbi:hypothetical protein M9H77_11749 [Catharanthus roseus]|uniref:Uncharacterized protein n=1 Tax=Catharanthus roseus TaxID=4058 RepID=A0ACC0BFI7_CATRO|nr:hypothetical protein M9H77_11749 [Catharanthus roseus]